MEAVAADHHRGEEEEASDVEGTALLIHHEVATVEATAAAVVAMRLTEVPPHGDEVSMQNHFEKRYLSFGLYKLNGTERKLGRGSVILLGWVLKRRSPKSWE